MKKLLCVLCLLIALASVFAACDQVLCQHRDADDDSLCDKCGEEYIDGVTIDHKKFYEKLIETDVHPTTSQVIPAVFEEEYELAKQAGEVVVVITLSSKLSGTYQSAIIARNP